MKLRTVLVACDCGGKYTVQRSRSRSRQRLILDYAICPHCQIRRMPYVWLAGDYEQRCSDCGIPFRLQPKMAMGRCNTDYLYLWRSLTKQRLLVIVSIEPDSNSA